MNKPFTVVSTTNSLNFSESGWNGWITPKETERHTFMKRGEWNVIRVRAVGKSVKTWINGNFVIEQVIPDNRHETNNRGFAALQCADKHGIKPGVTYKIAFKNIRIREIASPGHREPKEREKKEGSKAPGRSQISAHRLHSCIHD